MKRPDSIFAFGPPDTGFYVLIEPTSMIVWIDINGLPESKDRTLVDAIHAECPIIIRAIEGRPRHLVKVDWAASYYKNHTKQMAKISKIVAHLLAIVESDEAKLGLEYEDPPGPPNTPTASMSSDGAQYST